MFNLLATITFALGTMVSGPSPAQWQSDYGKALAATRLDDRPLLVVLDVPGDPKAAVASERLQADGEQSKLLDAYQRCHIDASTEYGKKVAQLFGAKQFPFTVIIDKTGSVVLCKKMGQLSHEEWMDTLATYQKGERRSQKTHTAFFRGEGLAGSVFGDGVIKGLQSMKADCPDCNLRTQ